jgi:hypothetical protein
LNFPRTEIRISEIQPRTSLMVRVNSHGGGYFETSTSPNVDVCEKELVLHLWRKLISHDGTKKTTAYIVLLL